MKQALIPFASKVAGSTIGFGCSQPLNSGHYIKAVSKSNGIWLRNITRLDL